MKIARPLLRIAALMASLMLTVGFLRAQTTVQVNPATATVLRGGTLTMNVDINNVTYLLASHVVMTFDSTKLKFNNAVDGGVMPAGGFFAKLINGNTLAVDQSVMGSQTVTGSGTLFTVSFTALEAVDPTAVSIAASLRDSTNAPIAATVAGAQVTVQNPLPHVTSVSPTSKTAGDPTFVLTVSGSGFVPASVVWFKGTARATSFVDASTLTVTIPGVDIQTAGLFPVTVVNALPGGGTSTEVVNLQVINGAAAIISMTSGDGQSATVNSTLSAPFVVTVTDAYANPVAGVTVTFAPASSPTGAAGQALSATGTTTDANGHASSTLTLGNKVGGYSVTATSTGLTNSPIQFSATAIAGALDHFGLGTISTQTAGTPFDVIITALDAANNTVTGFTGTVNVTVSAGTIAPTVSGTFTNGAITQTVTVTGSGTGVTVTVNDGGSPAHSGVSNAFDVLAMPNVFASSSPAIAAAGLIFPNTAWTVTASEPDDWSFLSPTVVSIYVVPEPGMSFNASNVTLGWDATKLSLAGVSFGASGSPNGLFGSGQAYAHTESFIQNSGTVTINATRTDGSDFSPVAAGDYIARVDFTLLKPGYAVVNMQNASFQRVPSRTVQVNPHAAEIKAYLGDVASGPPPASEPISASTGDGQIDFQDLALWSGSYWSGVAGYASGMTYYKSKFDFGPTQDGSVFSLPVPDSKIDFEDLVIFSMAYGLSSSGQLPKIAPPSKEPLNVFLGEPKVSGTETRIGVMLAGTVADVRALRFELTGEFGKFLGVENGELLKDFQSRAVVMSRSDDRQVFVDLAVLGLGTPALEKPGEAVVLRFEGTPRLQLTRNDARNSGNVALPVMKIRGAGEAVPTAFQLKQNYPNPFNPTTTIAYEVPATGEVTVEVYNMIGQKIATLVQENQEPGFYQVQWNGRDSNQRPVASGMYLYRMHAGSFASVKKMMLLK